MYIYEQVTSGVHHKRHTHEQVTAGVYHNVVTPLSRRWEV